MMYIAEPPDLEKVAEELLKDADRLMQALNTPLPGEYLHWDKLRHLEPPTGLTSEAWWWAIKWRRRPPLLRVFPLTDKDGLPFAFALPDQVLRLLHHVDQKCSGEIAMPEVVTADEQARSHYLVNSLMEEAIRSSQLEGATTTRNVAKELLRTGREPRDRSERMILNNYRALEFMREGMGERLTPEAVLELQRILTTGTLDNPDAAGRLQRPEDDRVAVFDRTDESLVHNPPPAEQLPERLRRLCDFGNAAEDPEEFIPPAVRAILLHFWLAYDHPFEDGNGRTARALFYWSMRTQGYWLVEYLSISTILRKAPAKYMRAFMLTETDGRDATYFLIYQLEVMERAIKQLHSYLRRKAKEVAEVEQLMNRRDGEFNHRQLALLSAALRNQQQTYTFKSHASSHRVTHETSRRDLLELYERGLLDRRRSGRQYSFRPPAGLPSRLRDI